MVNSILLSNVNSKIKICVPFSGGGTICSTVFYCSVTFHLLDIFKVHSCEKHH